MAVPKRKTLTIFDRKRLEGCAGVIGVDEVGRGSYAGPVVACAVFIGKHFYSDRSILRKASIIYDSKELKVQEREKIYRYATQWKQSQHIQYALGEASPREVEELNIARASKEAMRRAVETLIRENGETFQFDDEALPLLELIESAGNTAPSVRANLLVDGRPLKDFPYPHESVIQGDSKSLAIALAANIAKVTRDRMMANLDRKYPAYGFAQHKGYGTPKHLQAILANGACKEHRKTFLRRMIRPDHEKNQELMFGDVEMELR